MEKWGRLSENTLRVPFHFSEELTSCTGGRSIVECSSPHIRLSDEAASRPWSAGRRFGSSCDALFVQTWTHREEVLTSSEELREILRFLTKICENFRFLPMIRFFRSSRILNEFTAFHCGSVPSRINEIHLMRPHGNLSFHGAIGHD